MFSWSQMLSMWFPGKFVNMLNVAKAVHLVAYDDTRVAFCYFFASEAHCEGETPKDSIKMREK